MYTTAYISRVYSQLVCDPLLPPPSHPGPQDYSYTNCDDVYGDYGEDVSCLEDSSVGGDGDLQNVVVEAICGSGRDDDCDGHSHMVSQEDRVAR